MVSIRDGTGSVLHERAAIEMEGAHDPLKCRSGEPDRFCGTGDIPFGAAERTLDIESLEVLHRPLFAFLIGEVLVADPVPGSFFFDQAEVEGADFSSPRKNERPLDAVL